MSGHTQGEWKVTGDEDRLIIRVADEAGKPIATMWMNGDSMLANARLMAAAPQLREALEFVAAWFHQGPIGEPPIDYVNEVIALTQSKTDEGGE